MSAEPQHSDPEDPFLNLSAVSLFPRTLGVALHAEATTSAMQELNLVQSIFKSMERFLFEGTPGNISSGAGVRPVAQRIGAHGYEPRCQGALKGSTKLLEQAHVISKNYPDIQNLYSETEDKAAIANSKDGKDRPQGRRPALGHKKAQFSLKPISSHSLPTIDFSASFDHIEDPVENFLVFEQLENNSSPSRDNLSVDGRSKNLCILPDENDETQGLQEASEVSPNRGQKKRAPPRGQNKQKSTSKRHKFTSRRQSLEGVRRSTRIKSRPLDYWRGERFLYGRIHDSLATVIGLKYASPGKDAKAPVLKVKSFVSQKYADLVAQAASH